MDYTVHGILQARTLEWVAFSFSGDLPNPGIEPRSPALQVDSLLAEPQGNFADKGPSSQSYGFSSSHVRVWEWDRKESWAPKNWCFWTVVLEKTVESLSDCKEIKPVHPKGDQSWIFTGRTDAEAEATKLWPPDVKNWLIGKDPDAGKDWRQEEKGTTEDEMVGWHHWLNGHEFEQVPGVGDGQRSLECYSPWVHKESDTTEQLNWTESHHRVSQVVLVVNNPTANAGRCRRHKFNPWVGKIRW